MTTAFTTEPPTITIRGERVKLRAFNTGWPHLVTAIAARVDNPKMLPTALVVGFATVYSLPPAEAYVLLKDGDKLEVETQKADMELTPEDFGLVDEYLDGVIKRAQEAAVSVEGRAGKSPATATRPPRKRKKSTSSRANTGGRRK